MSSLELLDALVAPDVDNAVWFSRAAGGMAVAIKVETEGEFAAVVARLARQSGQPFQINGDGWSVAVSIADGDAVQEGLSR